MAPRRGRALTASGNVPLGLERLVFFSDAVMAIAITLLVIDLKLPDISGTDGAAQLAGNLAALSPRLMSFVISFAVIGVYWSSHHRYFGHIRSYDGRLLLLNLIFLFFIVLMPFAASMLGQFGYLPIGTIVYGAAVSATGFAIAGLWWYASHQEKLVDPGLEPDEIRRRNTVAFVVPSLFLVSLPFAFIHPLVAQAIWWVAPFAAILVLRGLERRKARG